MGAHPTTNIDLRKRNNIDNFTIAHSQNYQASYTESDFLSNAILSKNVGYFKILEAFSRNDLKTKKLKKELHHVLQSYTMI